MKLFLTLTLALCFITLAQATEKQVEHHEAVTLESVESAPMTRKAVRQERRMQKFEKLIAKYASARDEGRVVAAALFAFFLGGLGIHRVYLGGTPLLILGYLFTFGGLFGILPLIDFIRIVAVGTEHYEGNDRLFAAFENFGAYE